jgi:hypothetical protein
MPSCSEKDLGGPTLEPKMSRRQSRMRPIQAHRAQIGPTCPPPAHTTGRRRHAESRPPPSRCTHQKMRPGRTPPPPTQLRTREAAATAVPQVFAQRRLWRRRRRRGARGGGRGRRAGRCPGAARRRHARGGEGDTTDRKYHCDNA